MGMLQMTMIMLASLVIIFFRGFGALLPDPALLTHAKSLRLAKTQSERVRSVSNRFEENFAALRVKRGRDDGIQMSEPQVGS